MALMAKQPPKKRQEQLNPSLPKHTYKYLKQLIKTGVHGKTVSEVSRILIYDQIKFLLHKGAIRWEYAENGEELVEEETGD